MVNRVVVGAHYGLRDWIAQRVTAVVMAVYTLLFVGVLAVVRPHTAEAWRAMFGMGFMRFATFLFWVALFYHAWIGIREIAMDYVKPVGMRLALHALVIFLLIGYAGWAAQILWRL